MALAPGCSTLLLSTAQPQENKAVSKSRTALICMCLSITTSEKENPSGIADVTPPSQKAQVIDI